MVNTSANMTTVEVAFFTTVFSFLILVNLVANTLVCLVILKNPVLRTSINILIVNLAVSDMLLAFWILPQHVLKYAFVHPNGTTGDYLCRFVTGGSFAWLGDKSSVFTVVLIAWERFKGIHSPFSTRVNISNRTLRKLIVACWALALVLNGPLFYATSFKHDAKFATYRCEERWGHTGNKRIAETYTVINLLATGAVPFVTIVYLYTRVAYALWNRTVHSSSRESESKVIQERKHVTKIIIAVSLLFGILRFPNIVLYLLSQFDPKKYNFGNVSYKISVTLVVLNSSINPFMYSLHSTRFREHLRHMFRPRRASTSERTPLLT